MQNTVLSLATFVAASVATTLNTGVEEGGNMLMNMRPGLVPPEGTMWRGATMDTNGIFEGGWASGTDPQ